MPRSRTAEIDDQGDDPDERIVVLETGHDVQGDEAQDLAVVVGHDHRRIIAVEPAQARFDGGRTGRVALFGEQRCDTRSVGSRRGAQGDVGFDHGSDGTRSALGGNDSGGPTRIMNGPQGGPLRTSLAGPSGPLPARIESVPGSGSRLGTRR